MRALLKALLVFLAILVFIALLAVARCLLVFSRKARPYCVSYMLHIFNKILARILGIKVKLSEEERDSGRKGTFFAINHFSYIDGIAAGSIFPFVFIGKADLKDWPLLGLMIRLSETVFVNRASALNIKCELKKTVLLLNSNVNVILFPEGTSSNGKTALPFKSSFFAAPLECGSKIVPLTIKYTKVNNRKINDENKDLVYWYGDMEFFPHFMGVLGLRSIEVALVVNPPLDLTDAQGKTLSLQRKYVSNLCQEIIRRGTA